jgi:hypothetical protein
MLLRFPRPKVETSPSWPCQLRGLRGLTSPRFSVKRWKFLFVERTLRRLLIVQDSAPFRARDFAQREVKLAVNLLDGAAVPKKELLPSRRNLEQLGNLYHSLVSQIAISYILALTL